MQGNVPLHLAASTGSLRKCICIAKADPSLGNERNKEGESPLFSAAILGRTEIFLCLRSICKNELHSSYFRKNGGETILHCAIKRNCWDLAYQLLLLNHSKKKKLLLPNSGLATSVDEKLATFVDEKGNTPLHFLADKPSAFKRNVCDKGKKADEENPESSNVSPKSGHEGEECNCIKCVLIPKESVGN
uniref:Uncharacterized protein n=1 Tax=Quercus lobata TaxID=97700 RepID=A0A7N2N6Y1_QUELO